MLGRIFQPVSTRLKPSVNQRCCICFTRSGSNDCNYHSVLYIRTRTTKSINFSQNYTGCIRNLYDCHVYTRRRKCGTLVRLPLLLQLCKVEHNDYEIHTSGKSLIRSGMCYCFDDIHKGRPRFGRIKGVNAIIGVVNVRALVLQSSHLLRYYSIDTENKRTITGLSSI